MVREQVRGALPPAPRRTMEIRRVKSSESCTYICFSEAVFGQLTHWYGNRSHECTADKRACNGCARGWPTKWRGYLHVQAWGHESDCFLEISNTCWYLLVKQLAKNESLRGVQFKIRKTKGGAKGRFIVEVLERRAESVNMPQEKDPVETLRFLWSCKKPAQEMQS